jgi:A/G-specific adenine glycosylase
LLLETRPDTGLLGGMLGWPGSGWAEDVPEHAPPVAADWRELDGTVRHVFTHFDLTLTLRVARVGLGADPAQGRFVAARDFRAADLPTVMRKAYDMARHALADDGINPARG